MSTIKDRAQTTNTIQCVQDKKNGTFMVFISGLPVLENDDMTPLMLALDSVCTAARNIFVEKLPELRGSSLTECVEYVRERMGIEETEVSRG